MANQTAEQLKITSAIRTTLETQGWRVIADELDKYIASATDIILTGKDVGGNDLEEAEIKNARIALAIWKKAKSIPATLIAENTPATERAVDDDVYYKASDLTKK